MTAELKSNIIIQRIKEDNGFNIFNIMFFSFLFRFLISFTLISFIDLPNYTEVGNYLNYNINPYDEDLSIIYPINFYQKYPPLFFEMLGGWFYLFGNSVFSLRMLFLIFDLGSTYMVYIIGLKLKNKESGKIMALIFTFIPFNFIGFAYGENDSIPVFFTFLAIYFFFRKYYYLSSVMLGLGILFKIYPIFIFAAFLLYYFKKKMYRVFFLSIFLAIILFLLISLPFLFLGYEEFFNSILFNLSRVNTGVSFSTLVMPLFTNTARLTIFSLQIQISYNTIIELCIYLLIISYILFKFKSDEINNTHALLWAVIFLGLQPIFMHKGNISLYTWYSPMMIVLLFIKEKDFYPNNKKNIRFIMGYYILFIISLIIYSAITPFNAFQSFQEMVDPEYYNVVSYHRNVLYNETVLRWIDLIKLSLFIPWIVIFLHASKKNYLIISLILILNFTDWATFYLQYYLGENEVWIFIFWLYYILRIVLNVYLLYLINKYKQLRRERWITKK